MMPTPYQISLLHHTLGLRADRRTSHRNHFVAGPGHGDLPHLEALVAGGLMERRRAPRFLADDDIVFAATPAGVDIALAALPPEPVRTRYGDWLAADGAESFGEFLCRGQLPKFERRGSAWRRDAEYRMYRLGRWPHHHDREVAGEWAPTMKAARASYKDALKRHNDAKRAQRTGGAA